MIRPGHYLQPGVDEREGLKQILNERLGPADPAEWSKEPEWEIGECLSTWWRPNFESYMVNHDDIQHEWDIDNDDDVVSICPCSCHQTQGKENVVSCTHASSQ